MKNPWRDNARRENREKGLSRSSKGFVMKELDKKWRGCRDNFDSKRNKKKDDKWRGYRGRERNND